jgi:peptidoglycan-N-acetylglucosamine deacetylase
LRRSAGRVALAASSLRHGRGTSTGLLRDLGFEYDSSLAADDSCCFARAGDVARLDGGFRFGGPTEIVEIPVSWSWDDFPQFEFVSAPAFMAIALASPSMVFEARVADPRP